MELDARRARGVEIYTDDALLEFPTRRREISQQDRGNST
jgi:hypothetical protein